MKKFVQITLLLILIPGFSAYTQDILKGYLVEAAGNNPGLQGAFNEYLAALEKIPRVSALPDPQVTFGYFIQPVETRLGPQQARISVMQMFPWFGTLGAKEDAAADMAKARYEVFNEAKARLFYDVKSTYYDIYYVRQAIGITMKNIEILNTFRNLALIKVESGTASAVDVLRAEMEIADLENQLALMKDILYTQQVAFNNLLNVDITREIALPDLLPASDVQLGHEAILDSIRAGNPTLIQLNFIESAFKNQARVASKSGKPGFSVGIDYMVTGESPASMPSASESGNDAVVFPMLSISVPLYRQKYRSAVKEAVYFQKATLNRKEDKMNVLESVFTGAEKDYRDADRRIPLYRKQSERADKALRILETDYATNAKDFEEILRMERQLLKYNLELEKALADKNAAVAFINYLMGR